MVYLRRFKDIPEDILINCIKNKPSCIQYIDNQTEEMQDLALSLNPWLIDDIKNPTEKRQLKAVKTNAYVIRVINSPSEEVKKTAARRFSEQKEESTKSRESLFAIG
jgi:hypothetical protein